MTQSAPKPHFMFWPTPQSGIDTLLDRTVAESAVLERSSRLFVMRNAERMQSVYPAERYTLNFADLRRTGQYGRLPGH